MHKITQSNTVYTSIHNTVALFQFIRTFSIQNESKDSSGVTSMQQAYITPCLKKTVQICFCQNFVNFFTDFNYFW